MVEERGVTVWLLAARTVSEGGGGRGEEEDEAEALKHRRRRNGDCAVVWNAMRRGNRCAEEAAAEVIARCVCRCGAAAAAVCVDAACRTMVRALRLTRAVSMLSVQRREMGLSLDHRACECPRFSLCAQRACVPCLVTL